MDSDKTISTVHAITVLIIGLFITLTTRNPVKVAWVTAYICGAEILWRMTEAGVFWEIGKYAIVLLIAISLLRMRRVRSTGLPFIFFLLLSLSIPLTFFDLTINDARQSVSFNMSGPLCLAFCVLFFYQVSLSWEDRETLIWSLVTPMIAIAALCVYGIATAGEITFGSESNFATSGGYGPNQVSATLGLGALLMFLLALLRRKPLKRLLPLGLGLGFLTISVLTFSRGGLYNVAASLLVTGVLSLRSSRARTIFFPITIIAILIGGFFIFPQLNKYTGQMLEQRFADTNTAGRVEIMQAEVNVWKQHPLLGVGPGMASIYAKTEIGATYAAHTEYTRILAEHGIPGILAVLILFLIATKALLKAPRGLPQAWMAALLVWSLAEMTHAAMRIAAIGFIFGLAMAIWPISKLSSVNNKNGNTSRR